MREGQEKSFGFNLAAQTHGRDVAEMPYWTDAWERRDHLYRRVGGKSESGVRWAQSV